MDYSSLNIVITLYVLLVLSSLLVRGVVFLEWIISFVHYIIPFNLIVCILFLFIPQLFSSVFLLGLSTIPLLIRFLYFIKVKPTAGRGNEKIAILFFNKLNTNTNYQEIDEKIKEIKPDIIGMVELQEGEIEKIHALKAYQYKSFKPSRPVAALGLLSKYKFSTKDLESLPHAIVSTMDIKGEKYEVIVFHPNPPTYVASIRTRDNDLKNLKAFLQQQDNPNTILIGDFNVTPWSPSYMQYLSKLVHLKNTALGTGLHNTFMKGPLRVFIDFIFIPKKSEVVSFQTHPMTGSDHKLITAVVNL